MVFYAHWKFICTLQLLERSVVSAKSHAQWVNTLCMYLFSLAPPSLAFFLEELMRWCLFGAWYGVYDGWAWNMLWCGGALYQPHIISQNNMKLVLIPSFPWNEQSR